MKIYHNQLSKTLQQKLPLACLIFGDEPWQKLDALAQIKQAAVQQGFEEVVRLSADDKFNWADLVNEYQAMSLFASLRLIEVEIPTGKISVEGNKVLTELAEQLIPDIILVLHGPKIDAATTKKKWFTQIEQQGFYLPIYDIDSQHLPRWLNERAANLGLNLNRDVAPFLVDFFEGNLLALAQELEKLSLLYGKNSISFDDVENLVIKQAKFNPFQLTDALLLGDLKKCLAILQSLQDEGINEGQLIWILHKEFQQLITIHEQLQQGENLKDIFKQLRIWSSREKFYQHAVKQFPAQNINIALARLAEIDLLSKTSSDFNIYLLLADVCISLVHGEITQTLSLNYEYV